ncbi:MAG: rod shape-determining protein RodA [Verrucomicrobia bacterium]|nr:MAG: rod shape-determining protein RodA [Verrucomicrobiota bacterium]
MSLRFYQRLLRLDWTLVLAVLALLTIGAFFIFSASYRAPELPVSPLYRRQIGFALVGLGAFLGMVLLDYRRLRDLAWLLYLIGLVGLVLVLVPGIGKKMYGAVRWISIAGMQIQPSELAKLASILTLARFLSNTERDPERFSYILKAFAIVLPPVVLILKEPDLSTASVLLGVTVIMLFVAGVPLRTLGALALAGVLALGTLLTLLFFKPQWVPLSDYVKERIMVFFDPGRDPLNSGWNAIQSALAVGSGGLWGKGFLQGTQDVLGYLPRTVSANDFIFPVIAEETGFIGAMVLLSLYAVVLVAGVRAATAAQDKLGRLLATGLTGLVFCHVFVNIAMTIGLLPIMGIPLPLVSYGGTFVIGALTALGGVQSVYTRRHI